MKKNKITVYLPYFKNDDAIVNADLFKQLIFVEKVFVISDKKLKQPDKFEVINSDYPFSSEVIGKISETANSDFILLVISENIIRTDNQALEKLIRTSEINNSGWVYSDFYLNNDETLLQNPLIDYQLGSVRDEFNFGHLVLINTSAFKSAVKEISEKENYNYAGLYSLRLAISRQTKLMRIAEYLYTAEVRETENAQANMFKYVDPKNRTVQLEMEKAVSQHLKRISAFLQPHNNHVNFDDSNFEHEASVIIPVKNRAGTIKEAVESVLHQKIKFNYNIIVVDNHSTDSTTEILSTISSNSKNVIHHIPGMADLGIGGCWNEAINHNKCGRFAIQLDSDDLYSDENVLQKIVDKFYEDKCAMVIGSYTLTDFNLKEIPPGIIDHREWTDNNGHNNALRINGLGAPRAFYTPIIRKIQFQNVSYGEDYAAGLAVCRKYKIGRIYEPLYFCRRWEGNTDSNITIERLNANNYYKDSVRTLEILERQKLIKKQNQN